MNPGSLGSGAFLDVVLVLLDADSVEGTWLGVFAAPACVWRGPGTELVLRNYSENK